MDILGSWGCGLDGRNFACRLFRKEETKRRYDTGRNFQYAEPAHSYCSITGMNYPERLIPTHITRISSISPQEIYASLDAVPPFQKNGLIKSYEGIYIRWNTRLFSATAQSDDEVRLSLDIDKVTYKGVSCSVKLAEYKELGVMPKGTPITVIGKIKEIDSLSISLDDVHLYFTA